MRQAACSLREQKIPWLLGAHDLLDSRRIDDPVPDRKDQDIRSCHQRDIEQQRADRVRRRTKQSANKGDRVTKQCQREKGVNKNDRPEA